MTSPATTLARQTGLAHPPSAGEPLKPPLKSALGSLNVRLDDELMRYRRQRAGHAAPEPQRLPLKATKRPLDLIAVNGTSAQPGQRPTPPPPPPNPFITPGGTAAASTEVAVAPGNESGLIPHPQQAQPQDYLDSSADLLRSLADGPLPSEPIPPPTSQPSGLFGLPMPLGIGVLMLLLLGSGGLGYLLINPAAVSHLRQHPLLVSLGLGTAPTETADLDRGPADGSGLGILNPDLSQREFVELNLSSLTTLNVGTTPQMPPLSDIDLAPIAPDETSDPDASDPDASGPDPEAVPSPSATSPAEANAPDSTPGTPGAAPTAPARTPTAPQAAAPSAPAPAPQAAAPAPRAAAPAPTPAPTPPPQTAAAPRTNYYVVTDYTGDQSLDAARGIVGDAYVRNFDNGARIQLGAFDSEASARQWVQDLQNQGISARVQTP